MVDQPRDDVPLPASTTAEENRHTLGQRRVNMAWEATQSVIAIAVTSVTLYAAVNVIESDVLSNAFFLVVGFYFGRTNHQRVGGVEGGR